jgi:cytochrome c oxidase assembly factor CtaG
MHDGYHRADEIRSQLRAAWKPGALEPAATSSIGRTVAVAGFLIVAAVIALMTSRFRDGRSRARSRSSPSRRALAWVPGLLSLHEGLGWRAYFAVLVPVSVLLLPRLTTLGYRLPWGFNPGAASIWVLGTLLLLFYVFLRWVRARSEGPGVV